MSNKNGRKFPDPPKTGDKKVESVNISRATNGFTARCHYPYKASTKAEPMSDESSRETVFESKESLLEYLGKVL